MEEAENLCDTIGIMTGGVLRCIGTPQHLKNEYGNGCRITLRLSKASLQDKAPGDDKRRKADELRNGLLALLNRLYGETVFITQFNFSFEFKVLEKCFTISRLLDGYQEILEEYDVVDWSFAHCTLESAFLEIVNSAPSVINQ